MATKTTKKKKPNCTKGQVCGFSCIALYNKDGSKRKCSQPVPEEIVEPNIEAVPAKGKKQRKAQVKPIKSANEAYAAISEDISIPAIKHLQTVDPKKLKLKKSDLALGEGGKWARSDKDEGVVIVRKMLEDQGVDGETALAMAQATRAWLGAKYTTLSPLTFKSTEQVMKDDLKTGSASLTPGNIAILAGTIASLKAMPKVSLDEPNLKRDKGFKNWDKQKVNRWLKIDDPEAFAAKYKEGGEVTEDGMFGTSILSANKMAPFSAGANVTYDIKPKLDGTGKGHYVDHLKRKAHEGEILYEPGTKFKVTKVTVEGVPARPKLEGSEITLDNYKEIFDKTEAYKKEFKVEGVVGSKAFLAVVDDQIVFPSTVDEIDTILKLGHKVRSVGIAAQPSTKRVNISLEEQ